MSVIYDNILIFANRKGISIKALEEKAELGNGTIGKWQDHEPGLKNVQKVADILGVSLVSLLKEKKEG